MATKADKKKWDSLHVAQAKAQAAESEFDLALAQKYHMSYQDSWLTHAQKDKKDRLREKRREVESKIIDLLVEISPRGDRWLSGAPAHWLATELAWEDATRPANEPLSVVVPGSYGSRDGTVKEGQQVMGSRDVNKDAANFREVLEKGVILVGGEIVDNNSISLDDDDPVSVAIMVNVTGYGPHIGAICATQGGHIDSALQAADEILEDWEMDRNQEYFAELEKEHGDDARDVFTETFDGFMWELSPQEFADAIDGTGAEKFIEIDEPEAELEETRPSREVTKVRAWWDDQDPKNEGWYAMTYDNEGYEIDDSMKIWFPVNVDDFSSDEADELHDALTKAFPDAEVEVED